MVVLFCSSYDVIKVICQYAFQVRNNQPQEVIWNYGITTAAIFSIHSLWRGLLYAISAQSQLRVSYELPLNNLQIHESTLDDGNKIKIKPVQAFDYSCIISST